VQQQRSRGTRIAPDDALGRSGCSTEMPDHPFLGISVLQLTTPALLEPFTGPVPELTATQREALIDKLCERSVFESCAIEVYDELSRRLLKTTTAVADLEIQDLQQIRAEELIHVALLDRCLAALDSGPARTHSVCRVETELAGFIRLVSAPDSNFCDALHAAMSLELLDHSGWETLAILARTLSLFEMAERFHGVLQQETRHLTQLTAWYERSLTQ
jgi:hypothetical protein